MAQALNVALGAPNDLSDPYQLVKSVAAVHLTGEGIHSNGYNTYTIDTVVTPLVPDANVEVVNGNQIGVTPVGLNVLSSALQVTPSYYPNTNVVENYTLTLNDVDVHTIVDAGTDNVTIARSTQPPDNTPVVTISVAPVGITASDNVIISPTIYTDGTVKSYEVDVTPVQVIGSTNITVTSTAYPDGTIKSYDLTGATVSAGTNVTVTATPSTGIVTDYQVGLGANVVTAVIPTTPITAGISTNTLSVSIDPTGYVSSVSAPTGSQVVVSGTQTGTNGDAGDISLTLISNLVTEGTSGAITVTENTSSQYVVDVSTNVVTTVTPTATTSDVYGSIANNTLTLAIGPNVVTSVLATGTGISNAAITNNQLSITGDAYTSIQSKVAGLEAGTGAVSGQILLAGQVIPVQPGTVFVATSWTPSVSNFTFSSVSAALTYIGSAPTIEWDIVIYAGSYTEPSAITIPSGVNLIGMDRDSVNLTVPGIAFNTGVGASATTRIQSLHLIVTGASDLTWSPNILNFQNTTVTLQSGPYTFNMANTMTLDNTVLSGNIATFGTSGSTIPLVLQNQSSLSVTGATTIYNLLKVYNSSLLASATGASITFNCSAGQLINGCSLSGTFTLASGGFLNIVNSFFQTDPGTNFTWNGTGLIWDTLYRDPQISTANPSGAWMDRPKYYTQVATGATTVNYNVPFNPGSQPSQGQGNLRATLYDGGIINTTGVTGVTASQVDVSLPTSSNTISLVVELGYPVTNSYVSFT